MIKRTARSVLDGGVRSLCVVTGRDAHKIEAALSELAHGFPSRVEGEAPHTFPAPHLFCVHNSHFATSDMLHSIKLGLGALLEEAKENGLPLQALFIIPGDMPGVSIGTFSLLQEALEKAGESECAVFVPTYQGRRGHPLLIGKGCFETVLGFEGEGGLRQALAGFDRHEVATQDPGILLDADTPEAFEKLKTYCETAMPFR